MNINQPPFWIRKIFYGFNWKVKNRSKAIFLTFDDGPTPEVTEWVIKTLKEYDAEATFFCLGRNVERHPEIYQRIIEAGHATGNHTYSHLKGWKTRTKEYTDDIELASYYIHSKLFRPPYGKIHRRQINWLKKNGYKSFMWDVMPEDYNQEISPEKCLEIALNYTNGGTIIVFHDSVKASHNLYFVLPRFLKFFSDKGYNFKKLK